MHRSFMVAVSGALAVLVAAPGSAAAYNTKTTSTGEPLRWASGEVAIELALSGGPAEVSEADAEAAAVGAIATWQDSLVGAPVSLAVAETDALVTVSGDGVASVRWALDETDPEIDVGRLAVTHIAYRVSDGVIQDADVLVNAVEFEWTVSLEGCDGAYDLEGSLTHELGHLLGLAHSLDESATMFATGEPCETLKRDLEPDDRAGIDYLYRQLPPPGQGATDPDGGGDGDDTGEPESPVAAFGCTASGPGGQHSGGRDALVTALLAAGLAMLASRRRAGRSALAARAAVLARSAVRGQARWISLVVAGLAASGAGVASAGELRLVELDELGARADLIVRGVVTGSAPAPGGAIATDSVVAVSECLAGDCPARVTVRRRGGEQGDRGLWVDGEAELRTGEEVVLYLRPRDQVQLVVGGVQGVLRVVGRGGAASALRDLRGHRVMVGGRWRQGAIERIDLSRLRRSLAQVRRGRATP